MACSPTAEPPSFFMLPDLVSHCHFPLIYHPQGDEIAYQSVTWLDTSCPDLNPKQRRALRGLQAGELTAYCYPTCTPERLRIVSDFMNYLFHLDNISDGMMTRETDVLADAVMNALWFPETYKPTQTPGKQQPAEEINAAQLARDYWSRCIPDAGPGMQARFKESLEMFFEAVNTQARARDSGVILDLESYIDIRRDTSGCKPVFDLIEYALDMDLPEFVVTDPIVKALNQGTNDLVTWSNDIFSYNVEQSRDDTHNMIVILMNYHGHSLQTAVDFVGELCRKTIDQFTENRKLLPSWGHEIDKMVEGYVQGLQDWITGSLHWSFMTKRYFQENGAEVKRTRFVKLLPKAHDALPECASGSESSVEAGVLDRPLSRNSSSPGTRPSSPLLPYNRIFTPPNRGHRYTIVSTSVRSSRSSSSSSPLRTPFSENMFPRENGNCPPTSLDGDSESPQVELSRKVPFGFRKSVTLSPFISEETTVTSPFSQSIGTGLPDRLLERQSDEEKPLVGSHHTSQNGPAVGPKLKPLRLSMSFSPTSYNQPSLPNHTEVNKRASISSSTVSSDISSSNNRLLYSAPSSPIPSNIRSSNIPTCEQPHTLTNLDQPQTAPLLHSESWLIPFNCRKTFSRSSRADRHSRAPSRLSEPAMSCKDHDEEYDDKNKYDHAIRRVVTDFPRTTPIASPEKVARSPSQTITTPRPTLLFAIASDDIEQVRRVLESGEAGPNDQVGPQSALEFTITNEKLTHKIEIVKTLLAFGADISAFTKPERNSPRPHSSSNDSHSSQDESSSQTASSATLVHKMDPATRYYVTRADTAHTHRTSALIHRSFFRPLTGLRYELVGQDCAIEQLFRVLSVHSQQRSASPIVALLCGPSGHGKSLLAHKFGSLLDVPTHTVNMTTLRSTHDLWQSYSMDPYRAPSTSTLAEFLIDNEGQRCVVVLDDIDKTEDSKALWSLLMPWETGRCSPEAGKRHIDVRNVIWLCTSNSGHELVFKYNASRQRPAESMSREEYLELTGRMRPRLSECLGASLMSRVTTILPFTPFSLEEKMAICTEALYTLAGESVGSISATALESMVDLAISQYLPAEGARSLYRAMSSQLVDMC